MHRSLLFAAAMLLATPALGQVVSRDDAPNVPGVTTTTTDDGKRVSIPIVSVLGGSGGGTPTGSAGSPNANVVTVQGINNGTPQPISSTQLGDITSPAAGTVNARLGTIAGTTGATGATAPTTAQLTGGRTASGNLVAGCVTTNGVFCAPVAAVAQSTGTVTAVAANTSTTVCPVATNPVTYEVQIYGTGPVLLGLDGQALTAVTPAAGSGAYILLPTQYTLYAGPVARSNAITAYTATAQTVVCNIITRA